MTFGSRFAFGLMMSLALVTRAQRSNVVIEDFERDDYGAWVATGTAFGSGPAQGTLPRQQAVSGFAGRRLVNTYFQGDGTTGTLTSSEFAVERNYITFLIGGGGYEGKTCINLLVDGKVVRSATGPKEGSETLAPASWDVKEFAGRTARIQIVDDATGGWGHVLVDQIVQSDKPAATVETSRDLTAEKRFLLLPVRNGSAARRMTVAVDGRVEREFVIELADAKPDWWAVLDIGTWKGKPLRLQVDRLPGGSHGLEQVRQDDSPPDAGMVRTDRPLFHFAPPRGWMNDPNGLVFRDGEFHLFYQFNPFGTRWQNMSWGHAVSCDLVRWEDLGVALPQQDGIMIFSGSAAVDERNTSGLGTAGRGPIVAAYTGHHVSGGRQTQNIAFSNDDGRTWTKYAKNPVIDIGSTGFRDPKIFWHAPSGKWVMLVSLADERKVRFYGSADLRHWNHLSDFGPAGAPHKPNWECPDLFPVPIEGSPGGQSKWVLHVGLGGGAVAGGSGGEYFVGDFDGTTFRSDDRLDTVRWTDYGNDFYAAVSWNNVPASDGRRLWIGWMTDLRYAGDLPTGRDWRGMMSVPRSLTLREVGGRLRLTQQPVRELQSLRESHRATPRTHLASAISAIEENAGDAVEIVAEFTPRDARQFGLKVCVGPGQETVVGYDVARREMFVDRTKSGNSGFHRDFPGRHAAPLTASPDGRVKLHVLVDRYSVELFGNDGESVITDLIFPGEKSRGVQVYCDGGGADYSLDLWHLKAAATGGP
jgi:fructan beta-fructosidase